MLCMTGEAVYLINCHDQQSHGEINKSVVWIEGMVYGDPLGPVHLLFSTPQWLHPIQTGDEFQA
jgi:hypothetical protein